MPKAFDEIKLDIFYGKEGSTKTKGIKYGITETTISGKLEDDIVLKRKQNTDGLESIKTRYFLILIFIFPNQLPILFASSPIPRSRKRI